MLRLSNLEKKKTRELFVAVNSGELDGFSTTRWDRYPRPDERFPNQGGKGQRKQPIVAGAENA